MENTEEKILYVSNNMRCWNSPSPGFWKWGTFLGKVIVTDKRFLFLSSGGSKMGSIATASLLAGPLLGQLILGKSMTKELALEALQNEGSFEAEHQNITEIIAKRRWDFTACLSISFGDSSYSFIQDPFGMNLSVMRDIEEEVEMCQMRLKKAGESNN